MDTYTYRCLGCGCPRQMQMHRGQVPRDRLGMYCPCCQRAGIGAEGMPPGAQVFALETIPSTQVPKPEPAPEPEYQYQHPEPGIDTARLVFARYLYEKNIIREGYGCAEG